MVIIYYLKVILSSNIFDGTWKLYPQSPVPIPQSQKKAFYPLAKTFDLW